MAGAGPGDVDAGVAGLAEPVDLVDEGGGEVHFEVGVGIDVPVVVAEELPGGGSAGELERLALDIVVPGAGHVA